MNLNAFVVCCAALHFVLYSVVCESQGEKLHNTRKESNQKTENKNLCSRAFCLDSTAIGENVDTVDDRGDSANRGRSKRQSYYGMIDREYDEFDSRRCVLKMERFVFLRRT